MQPGREIRKTDGLKRKTQICLASLPHLFVAIVKIGVHSLLENPVSYVERT